MPLDSDSSVVQASPTVLSSDLFSPGVATKVTFPFVRYVELARTAAESF